MLDLHYLDPEEPFEPGDLRILTEFGDNPFFVHAYELLCREIWLLSQVEIRNHSVHIASKPSFDSYYYQGDFYLVGTKTGRTRSAYEIMEQGRQAVSPWRYKFSDFVFHLTRFTENSTTVWYHFVITNTPALFGLFML